MEEEELITSGTTFRHRLWIQQFSFQNFTGCLGHSQASLGLLLFHLVLFIGILVAILFQGSQVPEARAFEAGDPRKTDPAEGWTW
ncbi:hypothetical protein VULLAG_LOCUS2631 [Vulpes lagopus]